MRITKNTSGYETKALRAVICLAHRHIRQFEGRAAPNWGGLRVIVRGRSGNHVSGCAYLGGHGQRFDVCLTVPREGLTARVLLGIAYHELMHTYGYRHRQYRDLKGEELEHLIETDYEVPKQAPPKKLTTIERSASRISLLLKRRTKWESRLTRAKRALQKIERSLRYYEREKPELIAMASNTVRRKRSRGRQRASVTAGTMTAVCVIINTLPMVWTFTAWLTRS